MAISPLRATCLVMATLAATACVSTRDRHGYVIERGETELEALAGVDTKESVLARFGEPSMRDSLEGDTWFYATSSTNTRAFFETETFSREIVAFHFDDEGVVTDVKKYGLEDGIDVAMEDRVTRTRGKELSVLEQLIGGVGQMAPAVDPDAQ